MTQSSDIDSSPRRGVTVSIPGRHEGAERIAGVLRANGLLSELYVPANFTRPRDLMRSRFGPRSRSVRWLEKWAHEAPASSAAIGHELVLGAVLRSNRIRRRSGDQVTRWRNRAVDRRAASDVARGLADGALAVQGFPTPSLAASRARHCPAFLFAAMDIWGVNRTLVEEAREGPPAQRQEVLSERNVVFESDSTISVRLATHAIVQSGRMADRLREVAGHEIPTTTIGYGVDLPERLGERDSDARPLHVLTAARVRYAKGICDLGAAVASARADVASAIVAGGGAEEVPGLVRTARRELRFVGHQPREELARLYREADVFVLPTWADAMARTVLEAMASGLPVIVTPEAGYEGVVQDGVHGFVVPARDPEAIAARLVRLSSDGELRQRMGRAARELANDYSWPAFEERVRTKLVPAVAEALARSMSSASCPPRDLAAGAVGSVDRT